MADTALSSTNLYFRNFKNFFKVDPIMNDIALLPTVNTLKFHYYTHAIINIFYQYRYILLMHPQDIYRSSNKN